MQARWVLIALALHAVGAAAWALTVSPRTAMPAHDPTQAPRTPAPHVMVVAALARAEAPAQRERVGVSVPGESPAAPVRANRVASVAHSSESSLQPTRVHQGFGAGADLPDPEARSSQKPGAPLNSAAVQAEAFAPQARPAAAAPAPANNPTAGEGPGAAAPRATPTQGPRIDASWQGNTPPPYPSTARRQGLQGTVKLDLLIEADGSVAQIHMRESSGSPMLDRSVMTTVRQWRFIPARHQGQSVAAWYSDWEWVFRLQEGS